jgi:hypothetical protein
MTTHILKLATLATLVTGGALLTQAFASATQATPRAGILQFDLTTHGISPATVTVSPGLYLVTVRNAISLSQLNVQLTAGSAAAAVIQDSIKAGKSGLQQLVQLQVGKYTLTVGTRTEWTATLVVTASGH